MFNNVVLNVSTSKLTVNYINKDILMLIDLLIDSEVTVHMIVNWRIFTQFSTEIFYYQTKSDKILESSKRDTICINFNINNKSLCLNLNNCIYVSDLYYNLISISQLITKEVKTVFKVVRELLKLVYISKILAYANLTMHNIYILQVKHLLTLNKMINLIELWHQWLTYIRYNNILKLKSISTGFKDVNIMSSKEICSLCMKDHQKKSSFNHQSYNRELMTKTTKFL